MRSRKYEKLYHRMSRNTSYNTSYSKHTNSCIFRVQGWTHASRRAIFSKRDPTLDSWTCTMTQNLGGYLTRSRQISGVSRFLGLIRPNLVSCSHGNWHFWRCFVASRGRPWLLHKFGSRKVVGIVVIGSLISPQSDPVAPFLTVLARFGQRSTSFQAHVHMRWFIACGDQTFR